LLDAVLKQIATEAPAGRLGSVHDPLFRGARILFAGIAIVVVALVIRGMLRPRAFDRRWVIIAVAGFAGALAVRALLPFSPRAGVRRRAVLRLLRGHRV
jgi:hypothetical protein